MLGLIFDSGSAVTDTRPQVVLIEADSRRNGAAVSVDPDRQWYRFLDDLQADRRFQPHHLSRVREVWQQLREHIGPRLGLPVTQPTPEGAIQLYWDVEPHYVEIDIYSDGTLHWFAKDRRSGAVDGTDDQRVRGVPSHLLAHVVALVS